MSYKNWTITKKLEEFKKKHPVWFHSIIIALILLVIGSYETIVNKTATLTTGASSGGLSLPFKLGASPIIVAVLGLFTASVGVLPVWLIGIVIVAVLIMLGAITWSITDLIHNISTSPWLPWVVALIVFYILITIFRRK
jgi:hypothetical protein